MKSRELQNLLEDCMQIRPSTQRMDETIHICKDIMRKQFMVQEEERTGFWQFLSDVLRFEGIGIFGFQVLTLFVVCFGLQAITDALNNIPIFMPLFVLAILPSMFKGRYHGMYELEAVTRTSNAQIILAKLILAGGANLICMTILLCMEIFLNHSTVTVGQLILYIVVPYLVCMTVVLRCLRLRGGDGLKISIICVIASCAAWWFCARTLPEIYEVSAIGIWIVAFFLFTAIFLREIHYIVQSKKEGKTYGIIA